jgi:pyruvate, water dikinase
LIVGDRLFWLEQIQAGAEPWVGSQLWMLAQVSQGGLPVLQGFVISSALLNEAMAQLQDNAQDLDWEDLADLAGGENLSQPRRLQHLAETLQTSLLHTTLSPCWEADITAALLTLSSNPFPSPRLQLNPCHWIVEENQPMAHPRLLAQQYCWATPAAVITQIKQLWVDLFQAKNILLWHQDQIRPSQIRLAILVQPGLAAIAAGRVLSGDQGWEVEATPGLMRTLWRGEVIPDRWVGWGTQPLPQPTLGHKTYAYGFSSASIPVGECLQGMPLAVEEGNRPSLNPPQLEQLLQLKKQLDCHLSSHQGWEWMLAFSNGLETLPNFYIQTILESVSPSLPAVGGAGILAGTELEAADTHLRLLGSGIAAANGQAIAPAWVVTDPANLTLNPPQGMILVAATVQPDWLPLLKQSAGMITESGGLTCHGAILARELGLPAVVGVSGAITQIQSGQLLLLDGEQGKIYGLSNPQLPQPVPSPRLFSRLPPAPQPQPPRLHTQLLLNLSQAESLSSVVRLPVDGVGLLRSESIFLELTDYDHPYLWLAEGRQLEMVQKLAQQIQQFAAAFHPRPVLYRALDLRSQEARALGGGGSQEGLESNPSLGRRGVFRYQKCPELLDLQLTALRQVHLAGYPQVHLMLPFVRSVEEFELCRQATQQVGLTQNPDFRLWIMAEVPSVLFLLPDYVQAGVQGISIGSNDLTQLLLGVDREQSDLALQFDQRHPAVKAAIAQLVKSAQRLNLPCTICGEAPACYPEWVDWLVELGITGISVTPEAALATGQAIAEAELRHYEAGLRPR